jgi:hypothetical protein
MCAQAKRAETKSGKNSVFPIIYSLKVEHIRNAIGITYFER